MKWLLLSSVLIVMGGMASACAPAATAQPANATVTAAGQGVYQANCAVCHGADGAGGKAIGTATSADLRAKAMADAYRGDTSLIKRAILTGKDQDNNDLDAAMPRWTGKLSDADVNALIQYLPNLK